MCVKIGGDKIGTFIVGAIVLFILTLALASMIKDKKNGKSIQCGGDCKHCGGICHSDVSHTIPYKIQNK